MHISHVQSVQVYASVSFDTVLCMVAGAPLLGFRVRGSVLCARDVVTEMAVALHAIGAKCEVYHVAERQTVSCVRTDQSSQEASFRAVTQPTAALQPAARAMRERALPTVCTAMR